MLLIIRPSNMLLIEMELKFKYYFKYLFNNKLI